MLVIDHEKLQCFAYELRKQDEANDYYTDLFLKDKVHPPILFDLIKSNFWNEKEQKMLLKDQFVYRLLVGNNNVFQYSHGNEKFTLPFIKSTKKKKTEDAVQFLLNPEGFAIVRGDKKLLTQQGEVQEGTS